MSAELNIARPGDWISRWTTIDNLRAQLVDSPSAGVSAWARTTAGAVALLLGLQVISGVLLAFYYVPTSENAYTTITYIEKAVQAGSWIRSLHYHTSQWLPVALILHLIQLVTRKAYLRVRIAWVAALVLLALSLAAAASGYVLPWDARAINGASIGAGIVGGMPLVGSALRRFVLAGTNLTTMTLSRFYALHVFVTPSLLLICVVARLFLLRDGAAATNESARRKWTREQLTRNAVVAAVVFLAAAVTALKLPAPFAPPASEAIGYLPRPGPQFLWLFELLKYVPSKWSSISVGLLPAAWFGVVAAAPWIAVGKISQVRTFAHRAVLGLLATGFGSAAFLIALACYQDVADPKVRTQLADQKAAEIESRSAPFIVKRGDTKEPAPPGTNSAVQIDGLSKANFVAVAAPPAAYSQQCAKCHGPHGEGAPGYDGLIGVTTRDERRRTVSDLVSIINNPRAFALQLKMRSFADKLNEDEKHQIAEWIASLK